MADWVIDTNVWVMVDKTIADVETIEELDCIAVCRDWLKAFMSGEDRIVTDYQHQIYNEYRNEVTSARQLAYNWLNQLQTAPRDKEAWVSIALDDDNKAIIPFFFSDPSDRKFIAVALAHEPTPVIVNATDTDWEKDKQAIQDAGLVVEELCEAYIENNIK